MARCARRRGPRRHVFMVTAGIGLRERLITAIPASLKHAIAAGIGLLIATIGLPGRGEAAGYCAASTAAVIACGSGSTACPFTKTDGWRDTPLGGLFGHASRPWPVFRWSRTH